MIFKCTQCGQALRAADNSAGKYCKCDSCQTLIKIPSSPRAETKPAAPVGPSIRSHQPAKPRRPAAEPKLNEDLGRFIPPVNLETARPPDNDLPPPRPRYRPATQVKRSQNSGPNVLVIVLSTLGVLCFLCCGGLFAIGVALGPRTITITAGGYSATAQGREVQKKTEAGGETQGGMHPFTGSEFWIGSLTMPISNDASIEDVRDHFQSFTSNKIEFVQRGSVRGIHCTGVNTRSLGINGGDKAEFEVFLVAGRLLYMAYLPGSSKSEALGKNVRSSSALREQALDNADAFFASLRAN